VTFLDFLRALHNIFLLFVTFLYVRDTITDFLRMIQFWILPHTTTSDTVVHNYCQVVQVPGTEGNKQSTVPVRA
jgi:hypothetical protein